MWNSNICVMYHILQYMVYVSWLLKHMRIFTSLNGGPPTIYISALNCAVGVWVGLSPILFTLYYTLTQSFCLPANVHRNWIRTACVMSARGFFRQTLNFFLVYESWCAWNLAITDDHICILCELVLVYWHQARSVRMYKFFTLTWLNRRTHS